MSRPEQNSRPAWNAYGKQDMDNFALPKEPKRVVRNTDMDVLKREYRFIRESEEEDAKAWETRLARRHYERLYKDYAIADLSRWRQGFLGLRWLNQTEVLQGKGYSYCAATDCNGASELKAFQVPFTYEENGETKATLVKVRLCRSCQVKMRESFRIAREK
ncbi:hypothetical protein GpartN1_g6728.t1 [Galdieria partita]|uniref:Folate-sensitive fragile site protein Fra10Ac1-domain-containing protein n=1 Tax=Galdieria partita TaxID=83374 RepID=A0A9C7Q4B6_9RHOD|nr:hypothetical protein GpartN1_g6728.t1 [Galdieria partita]